MFEKFFILLAVLIFFPSVLLSGFKMLSRPSVEYDEGAYLTTFLQVEKGYTLYKETFFSQLPGFYYTTHPGFSLFGQSLEAGRLSVFIYSLITLLAILWLAYEAKNIFLGILTIALLYNLPIYFNETLTFHTDTIPLVFSTASIALILRFKNKKKLLWLVLSGIFFCLGVLIKLDVSVLPSLLLIPVYMGFKKNMSMRKIIILLISTVFFLIFLFYFSVLPFGGIKPFYNNVVPIRLGAINNDYNSLLVLFSYLNRYWFLLSVILVGFILSLFRIFIIKEKQQNLYFLVIFLWSISSILLLTFYRPLFPHHLVLLMIPFSLLFSYQLLYFLSKVFSLRLLKIGISIFLIYTSFNLLTYFVSTQPKNKNDLLNKGIQIINQNTTINDLVVTDDGLLTGLSGRLPPPWLSDISSVRVTSGALTSEVFQKEMLEYQPKLILLWSGRIAAIDKYDEILKNNHYQVLEIVDKEHIAYIKVN